MTIPERAGASKARGERNVASETPITERVMATANAGE